MKWPDYDTASVFVWLTVLLAASIFGTWRFVVWPVFVWAVHRAMQQ